MRCACLAIVLLALALAGCGLADSSTRDAAAPAVRTEGTLRLTKAEAREMARAMLVRSSDLPGWRATPRDKRDDGTSSCGRAGDLERRFSLLADERSPLFQKQSTGAVVLSDAALLRNAAKARRAFAFAVRAVKSKKARECLVDGLEDGAAAAGGSVGKPRIRPIRYPVAGRSSGVRIVFSLYGNRRSVSLHTDLAFVQEGQAVGFVLFMQAGEPFPRETELRLVRLMAKRMRLAQEAQWAQA